MTEVVAVKNPCPCPMGSMRHALGRACSVFMFSELKCQAPGPKARSAEPGAVTADAALVMVVAVRAKLEAARAQS